MRFIRRAPVIIHLTAIVALTLLRPPAIAQRGSSPAHPPVADVLKQAIAALETTRVAQYDVSRLDGYGASSSKAPGRTRVVAAQSPFRYSARFQTSDSRRMEMAVFDGTTTRWSSDGKADAVAARVIANDAAGDAGATGLFFDSSYYRKALDSGDVLYAGLDDVEGDLCHVIAYVTFMDKETGSDTRYVWISARTGLPRSTQSWRLLRGKTLLTARWIISNIEMDAVIAPETFMYAPTASDSTKPAPKVSSGPAPASKTVAGMIPPDLPLRDMTSQPVSLEKFKGTATILTFWAPWCGPCLAEMSVFKKLQDSYQGQLRIAAIAVKDSRLNVEQWIRKNPDYRFEFLLDGELGRTPTSLESFFDIGGIPVNVFLNRDGRIAERWVGFDNEGELLAKIKALMERR